MKRLAVLGAMWLAAVLAACGEGRAIFRIDVLSFLRASGDDTLRYSVLSGPIDITVDSSIPPVKVTLPGGLSKSSVVSDSLTLAALLENATGSGDVTYGIYFAKDSAQVYNTTPYINASSGPVSGAQTVTLVPPTAVTLGDTVFNASELWLGIRARLTVHPGANLTGRIQATTVFLTIVLQDKIF